MNIAKKNILSLEKNICGKYVINKIINDEMSPEMHYRISSKVSNEEEIDALKNKLDFDYNSNFIIIGIGNGNFLECIYNSMSKNSNIIVIEKYKSVLIDVLGRKDISHILENSRVTIILEEDDQEISKYFNVLLSIDKVYYNIKNIKFITMPYMKSDNEKFVNNIMGKFIQIAKTKLETNGNDIGDMLEGLGHTVENMKNIFKGLPINAFKNSYSNKPAIIVSGGPSLNKNINKLKDVYGKALILSVDTTAKKVIDMGIIPDGISTIERPDEIYNIFYEKMKIPKKSIFIGPPVVTPKILNLFDNLIIPGRSGEVFVREFLNEIGYEDIELGLGCATLAFAFAKYVDANPIIFIGQDLAFSENGETHFKEANSISKEGAKSSKLTCVLDESGKYLETTKIYREFLFWFENEILKDNERLYINATEGGAKINGTVRMMFKEAIEKYCIEDVTPLYDKYISMKSLEDDKSYNFIKVSKLINSKKEILKNIKKNVENYTKSIIQYENLNERNLDKVIDINRQLCLELFNDHMISFLYQTIKNSFFIELNGYKNNLKEEEWNKVIFITKDFHKKCFELAEVLIDKFEKYEDEIKRINAN